MGLTVAAVSGLKDTAGLGNMRVVTRTITFDSSYPTAGEALTPATLGLKVIHFAIPAVFKVTDGTTSILAVYDIANKKLLAQWGNAGSASAFPEVTDTTDLSTFSGRMTFVGF